MEEPQDQQAPAPENTAHELQDPGQQTFISPSFLSPEEPQKEWEHLQSELEKYKDMALRAQADLENYRKRMVREKEEALRFANTSLLERLLPIVDNFELGLAAAKNATDASAILVGMGMVQKQIIEFLKDFGVHPIDATGKPFDPNFHEAVGHEVSEEVPDGHVIRQLRSGYKLRDRLLRPSSVVVSKGPIDS